MPVQMELRRILISEMPVRQVIYLKEVDGEREFAIEIGPFEAEAINRRLKGIPMPRPLTHELLSSVIEQLGGNLDHIEINNLQDATFYARLYIRMKDRLIDIDCRPSDAIALGVATSVPIFVAEHVLDTLKNAE
ncbi:MAG TPA: bifunctional nuclease family protein [Tepidisphaeraceae bacterium]|jgi:hypothetical protein